VKRTAFKMLQMLVAGLLLMLFAQVCFAQLDQNCTVSVLNRTVRVNPDGSWVLPNVPANFGQVKARATCVRNGITISGESDYFTIPANGVVNLPTIVMGSATPIPASLTVTPANPSLSNAGQTVQLMVTAKYPDNSTRDVSAGNTGTNYTSSNPAIATVSANGLLSAVASGTVVIQASNDGATGIIRATVVLSNVDSDGDGIPDDIEISLGLDPQNPVDAQDDFDRDGLTNLREFQLGTNLRVFDTDGDGIGDGLEVQTNSNPLDPNSFNLAQALRSIQATPTSISLTVNTIIGVASRQLTVTGTLIDGNTINLTSTSRGTNYNSSNLSIANFGAVDGLVFAGTDGSATVSVTNSGFSAPPVQVSVSSFSPTALSFVSIPGFANNVDVAGNFAYVAAGSAGLRVVNVSDRRFPQIIGALDTPGNANDVKVVGNRVYVADGVAGLQIIDVTNPAVPTFLGSLDTAGEASDLVVVGNRVYLADGPAGLQIIDVSDPHNPFLLGTFDTPGTASGVDVSGNLAVIADGSGGIRIVDVSNPASPIGRGSLAMPDARDVTVEGNTAYVAAFTNSLRTVDFSVPTAPVLLATTPQSLGGILTDVAKVREFVFGADVFFVNGVPIVNVSNPASPVVRARLDFPARDDNGTGIAVDNEFVYLTADQSIQENGVNGNSRLYIGQYAALEDLAGIPPVVSITSPAAGATVTEGSVLHVTAQATDDVQVAAVNFLVNGNVVFTDSVPPYEFDLTVPGGGPTFTLGATAIDLGSNVGTAPNVVLNVTPDQPPTVSITAPTAGSSVIEGATLPITVQATDDLAVVSVNFLVNGAVVFTDSEAPYEFNLTVPTGFTTLTLGATALDSGGHTSTAANVLVNTIPDPLTTVVGRVLDENLAPLAGASVSVLGHTAVTAADGSFSIPNVPTVQGNIVVNASFTPANGTPLAGSSASTPPVPGGATNVGDIVVIPALFENNIGTLVLQQDDGSVDVPLPFAFPLYGNTYTQVFANNNGNLTFNFADGDYTESVSEFINRQPRIAAFWDDLIPDFGDTASGMYVNDQLPGRLVITWLRQLEYFQIPGPNTVQVILFSDGHFQIGYQGVQSLDAVVGVSPGGFTDIGPQTRAVDFSANPLLTTSAGDAIYEQFEVPAPRGDTDPSGSGQSSTRDNPFDLANGFIVFTPNSSGGFDIRTIVPPPPPSGQAAKLLQKRPGRTAGNQLGSLRTTRRLHRTQETPED
jgi:hypothetical protein